VSGKGNSSVQRRGAKVAVFVLALAAALLSVWQLERARAGTTITPVAVGTTPATLYRMGDDPAPLVVVAHGFAGSTQLMQAFSLTLARAGYAVLAFDFEGHGRNPVPMSGDPTRIDGTTRLLVEETQRVIDAGLALPGMDGRVALLGHSMASDVVVRTGIADPRVGAVVAVSMFSQAVTPTEPERLLAITGAWEGFLRTAALDAARLVDAAAEEDETVMSGPTLRRAAVAPHVEHVGVLYSETSLREAQAWLDAAFGRDATLAPARIGPWIALLMASLVALAWPLAALLPDRHPPAHPVSLRAYALALALPAIAAPLIATQVQIRLLPVLVADYLALHLALQGFLQIGLLYRAGVRFGPLRPVALAALLLWGLGVFGVALDRYGANFWPIPERLAIIAALALGTIPYMAADALATLATGASLLRRLAARAALLGSLALAVALDFERLFFLAIIFPVILLFFLVYGSMGRWVGVRTGATPVGLALGLILAWSLGVSFPMFAPG
jgi:dienelactone hydrolase